VSDSASARPPVSVVVPFGGGDAEALRSALERFDVAPGDELIVADNTSVGAAAVLEEVALVVPAAAERSSYHARNAGAAASTGEWLLFVDADCAPAAGLLSAYLAEPIPPGTGAVAGEILGEPGQRSLAARYARDRKVLSQTDGLYGRGRVIAATGNLMVRRAAFAELGGFAEGIRSAGDVDFCLRLREAGWRLDFRPQAIVTHRHRDSVPGLLRTFARYGAGSRWLRERHDGVVRWPLTPREVARSLADAGRLTVSGQREQAAFRLIDAAGLVAHNVGWRSSNAARRL